MSQYRVKVYKEYFDFSAAHFITYGGRCETLHGHNYHVEVTLEGERGPDSFVFNFSDLKPLVRRICDSLDHKMLLADHNALLKYQLNYEAKSAEQTIEVTFGKRRYLFPLEEVMRLPIENTTAEAIAAYILNQLRQALTIQARPELATLRRLEVGVEEQPGQAAFYSENW